MNIIIEEYKSSGFSGSLGSGGMSLSYGKSKTTINSEFTNYVETTIFAGESVKIVSDEGKISLTSTHVQAGEDIVLSGKTGVELLVAENYSKTVEKHKSTSIGVSLNFGFRPTQLINSVNNAAKEDYSVGNKSQAINTLGNRFQDIRTISSLGSKVYDGINAGSGWLNPDSYFKTHGTEATQQWIDGRKDVALNSLFDLSASISFSKNKSSSTTESTSSVGGSLNAGGNIYVASEGDVTFIGQTINAGKNIEINADNFFAGASMDTYYNKSKSSSTGASLGYDFLGGAVTGSFNMSNSKSNTDMLQYNNTTINAGGDFVLTTVGNAIFSGANVEGEYLILDIGGNLTVESLQDIMDSSSKSSGFGLSLSNINPSTLVKNPTSSLSGSINGSKSKGEQAWVSNQTSLVGRNGGSINVGNTLTNTGAIIGSLNENTPMIINAKEIVVNDLKDKDYSKNAGFGVSGITGDLKAPQTSIQYGMSDKRQDTNSTFVNTVAYENGVKVNFEERGINTSLDNAQVITKDKTIEQIDTTLHTDMLNKDVRQQFVIDFLKTTTLVPQVAKGISQGINNKVAGQNVLGQLANNLGKNGFNIVAYAHGVDEKLKDLIYENLGANGSLNLDEFTISEISGLLKPLLAEFGKDFYSIQFVEAKDMQAGMSINDQDGVVYINTYGQGFGNSSEMLEQLGHEEMHGTYANHFIDEVSTTMNTKRPDQGWSSSIGVNISESVSKIIETSTDQYNKDRTDGKLRDAVPLIAIYAAAYVILSNPKISEEAGKLIIAAWALIEMSDGASDKINKEKEKLENDKKDEPTAEVGKTGEKVEGSKKDGPMTEVGKVGKKELDELPQHVQDAYDEYTKGGWTSKESATSGTKVDEEFENREKRLPEEDKDGNKIEYREHDVNNKISGKGRGKERFVTGSDGSIYYTDTHYSGFVKIK